MIEKVVEYRYSDNRKTYTHYDVYYGHAIRRSYNSGNLPKTVINFILADDGKLETERYAYADRIPVKKTTYTR